MEKLDLLIALYIACIAISELMGAKTFPLLTIGNLHLSASVAIFVIPLIYTINDIVTEVYGKDRARSIVRSGLLVILFFLIFALFSTHLPPTTRFAPMEKSYDAVFEFSARIAGASLTAFTIAEFADVFIFAKLRQKLGKKRLWFRTNVSNIVSQLIDTGLFMVLAFYALDKPFMINATFLIGLIIPYWLLKCVMSIIETPFVYLGVRWLNEKRR